jgi:hypothetical protein
MCCFAGTGPVSISISFPLATPSKKICDRWSGGGSKDGRQKPPPAGSCHNLAVGGAS